jgi:hypothetical protein
MIKIKTRQGLEAILKHRYTPVLRRGDEAMLAGIAEARR